MFETSFEVQLLGAQIFLAVAGTLAGIRVVDDVMVWRNRKAARDRPGS